MQVLSNEASAEQLEEKLAHGVCRGGVVPATELAYAKSLPKSFKQGSFERLTDQLVPELRIRMIVCRGDSSRENNKGFFQEVEKLASRLLKNLQHFVGRPDVRQALDARGVRKVQLVVDRTFEKGGKSKQTATVFL